MASARTYGFQRIARHLRQGDIAPVSQMARTAAMLEATIGVRYDCAARRPVCDEDDEGETDA